MPSIIALHGFLGRPSDFKLLQLPGLIAPDIFRMPIVPMEQWAKRFNRVVPNGCIALGYSMGARLLFHCLIDEPSKFKAAIILAGHPGLPNEQQRRLRLMNDLAFADKLMMMDWKKLMAEWNAKGALLGAHPVVREEQNFCRKALALALDRYSLGRQNDLSSQISQLSLPILWLLPYNERKNIQKITLKHKESRMLFVKDGGHRFMFANPSLCARMIIKFFDVLK